MIFVICILAGPLIGWRLYADPAGAVPGAIAGGLIGGLLQIVWLVATLQIPRGWFRRSVALLIASVGVAALTVILKPAPPREAFQMATGLAPANLRDLQAARDPRPPGGYYFRFGADEHDLLAVVNQLELIPADALSDTVPPGAPSWWRPPRGRDVRCWTRVDARTAVELSESGGVAFLLMRSRAD